MAIRRRPAVRRSLGSPHLASPARDRPPVLVHSDLDAALPTLLSPPNRASEKHQTGILTQFHHLYIQETFCVMPQRKQHLNRPSIPAHEFQQRR